MKNLREIKTLVILSSLAVLTSCNSDSHSSKAKRRDIQPTSINIRTVHGEVPKISSTPVLLPTQQPLNYAIPSQNTKGKFVSAPVVDVAASMPKGKYSIAKGDATVNQTALGIAQEINLHINGRKGIIEDTLALSSWSDTVYHTPNKLYYYQMQKILNKVVVEYPKKNDTTIQARYLLSNILHNHLVAHVSFKKWNLTRGDIYGNRVYAKSIMLYRDAHRYQCDFKISTNSGDDCLTIRVKLINTDKDTTATK